MDRSASLKMYVTALDRWSSNQDLQFLLQSFLLWYKNLLDIFQNTRQIIHNRWSKCTSERGGECVNGVLTRRLWVREREGQRKQKKRQKKRRFRRWFSSLFTCFSRPESTKAQVEQVNDEAPSSTETPEVKLIDFGCGDLLRSSSKITYSRMCYLKTSSPSMC